MNEQTKTKQNHSIVAQWQDGEDVVYDYRKIWGIKSLMKGHQEVRAAFGQFEVSGRYVIHSVYNGDLDNGYDEFESISELIDDLNDLKNGRLTS
jgi:hypothetical protein